MLSEISKHSETKVMRRNLEAIAIVGKTTQELISSNWGGPWKLESSVVQAARLTRQKLKDKH